MWFIKLVSGVSYLVYEIWIGVATDVKVNCHSIVQQVYLIVTDGPTLQRLEAWVLVFIQVLVTY